MDRDQIKKRFGAFQDQAEALGLAVWSRRPLTPTVRQTLLDHIDAAGVELLSLKMAVESLPTSMHVVGDRVIVNGEPGTVKRVEYEPGQGYEYLVEQHFHDSRHPVANVFPESEVLRS